MSCMIRTKNASQILSCDTGEGTYSVIGHVYLWSHYVFSLEIQQTNRIRACVLLICGLHLLQVHRMVIISRHLLAWLSSTGPSHSQHRRKLSLVVSGQGGRASRARETQDPFIQHSQPLSWP